MTYKWSRREFLTTSAVAGLAIPSAVRATDPTVEKDVAWLAEVQSPPVQLPEDAPRLSSLTTGQDGRPIASIAAWEKRRDQLRKLWLDFLGYQHLQRPKQVKLEMLAQDHKDGVLRQLVRYEFESGWPTEAYILRPVVASRKCPGVVVLHSTVNHSIRQPAGVEGRAEKAFGLKLAKRGCVTICPRNYLWPTNHKIAAQQEAARFLNAHPKSMGMAKMLLDAVVALDILARQPEVDAKRLGAVGHSLGAKEVLYLAAFDPRVKVTVSSEGGIGTRFSNWDAPWYLSDAIRGNTFTREHHELLGMIAPRPFLLLGGDSADGERSWPFIQSALPVYELYEKPARVGLFNHGKGHAVPPVGEKRIYEWFDKYL
jgi:dienelactone hydrolase